MMEYRDFYDIAVYANKNWKGTSSEKETACNAHFWYTDFLWSKENNEFAHNIKELCKNLAEDIKACPNKSEEAREFLSRISDELGTIKVTLEEFVLGELI